MRTRPLTLALVLTLASVPLAGCQGGGGVQRTATTGLVGSWVNENPRPGEFNFASVTFAPDGTYTSKASYTENGEDVVMARTGAYTFRNNQLVLEGAAEGDSERREYGVEFSGSDQVVFISRNPPARLAMRRYSGG